MVFSLSVLSLAIALGLEIFLGILVFTFWKIQKEDSTPLWISAWLVASALFAFCRLLQYAALPQQAYILAPRLLLTAAYLLAWVGYSLGNAFTETRPARRERRLFLSVVLALILLSWLTQLVLTNQILIRATALGGEFHGVLVGPAYLPVNFLVLGLCLIPLIRLARAPGPSGVENRLMALGFVFIILFSLCDFIATWLNLNWLRLSDFSYLPIGFIFCFIQFRRLGRLYTDMNAMVAEHTAELSRANKSLRSEITDRILAEESMKASEQRFRRKAEEFTTLYETTHDLVIVRDLSRLLNTIVERATAMLKASGGGMYLCEPELHRVRCVVSFNTLKDFTGTVLKYGEGAAGLVAATGEPVAIEDYRIWPGRADVYEKDQPFISLLSVPMYWQDHIIGVIHVLENTQPRKFTTDERQILSLFASQAAIAIENARLLQTTQKRLGDIEAVHTVSAALRSAQTLEEALPIVLDTLIELMNVGAASLEILEAGSGEIVTLLARGGWAAVTGLRTPPKSGISGRVIKTGQPFMIADVLAHGGAIRPDLFNGLNSVACVPVIAHHQPIGALWIGRRTAIFNEEVSLLAAIGEIVGNAIHRMMLHEQTVSLLDELQISNQELARAYDTTLAGWAKALELHDKETEGHSRRVTDLTLCLARNMGITEPELTHILRGVLLHDIGKMGISDQLLRKPGALNEDEWVEMRKHPQYAYDLLSPIAFLRPALDIPYNHHERWDGTGYPRGAAGGMIGDCIPLSARIFAVVDVYDALSNDRPYRVAWPREQVLDYLQEQSGKQFDPQVVAEFLALLEADSEKTISPAGLP